MAFSGAALVTYPTPAILGFHLLCSLLMTSYWGYGDCEDLVLQLLVNGATGLCLLQLSLWTSAQSPWALGLRTLGCAFGLGLLPFHGWLQLFGERAPLPCGLSHWIGFRPQLLQLSGSGTLSPFLKGILSFGGAVYALYFGLLAFRRESRLGAFAYFSLAQNGLYWLYCPHLQLPESFLLAWGMAHGALYLRLWLLQRRQEEEGAEETEKGTSPISSSSGARGIGIRVLDGLLLGLAAVLGLSFPVLGFCSGQGPFFLHILGLLSVGMTTAFLLQLGCSFRKNENSFAPSP
ncbi:MAG: hypothetical protein LBF21_00650 [Puniceicoccales bacterium]|nr:hypothetical protein [Puniceicoccales bacterium]